MTNLKRALLATASLGILASPAMASQYTQYVDAITTASLAINPFGGQNAALAFATGANTASASATQYATVTANLFGDATGVIRLAGPQNTIAQGFGIVDVVLGNITAAFSPNGSNLVNTGLTEPATQLTSVNLNSANVGIDRNSELDLTQSNNIAFGRLVLPGRAETLQVNVLAAGYDVRDLPKGVSVTTGVSEIGTAKPDKGKNTTLTTQANVFAENSATISLNPLFRASLDAADPTLLPILGGSADALVVQKPGSIDVELINVAAAGSSNPRVPPGPPGPHPVPPVLLDPSITNLLQFNSVSVNSIEANSGQFFGQPTGTINLLSGNETYLTGGFFPPIAGDFNFNQQVGGRGLLPLSQDFTVGNVATALTWNTSFVPAGTTWDPVKSGGVGIAKIKDVTQVVSISLNSVSGNANVAFGGVSDSIANPVPVLGGFFSDQPFTQVAYYGPGGVQIDSALADVAKASFGVALPPGILGVKGGVNWANSVNLLVAGTGVGSATITDSAQQAFVEFNTVNLDNSLDSNGAPLLEADQLTRFKNTTGISGNLSQDALFIATERAPALSITNYALAVVGQPAVKGVTNEAAINGLDQYAVVSANSVSAGQLGGELNLDQLVVTTGPSGTLQNGSQVLAGPVVANSAIASAVGGAASLTDVKQIASYSANSFAILDTKGYDLNLNQVFTNSSGLLSRNPAPVLYQGNQELATGTSASITGAIQSASLNINTATIGTSLSATSSINQVANGVNVGQTNLAISQATYGSATATGLIQAAGVTVNSVTAK